MPSANIRVYLRIRPSAAPAHTFESSSEKCNVSFKVDHSLPPNENALLRAEHSFRFNGVLGMRTTQDEVFQTVAKAVIDDVLSGVNGTIFAYGQTGSGKTFTITGGGQKYGDRGLIPRSLNYIFEQFRAKPDVQYQMLVSYLEVYNENGYDLLRDDVATRELKDLPKVVLREDENENIRLSGLSVNTANTEEDALNLLFIGDTNRVVAETPMNDASTRSHCLFIIWIRSTVQGSAVVKCSKLHLVDLAGSERPSKTGVEGQLLKEAKYINLSLFYLEQVIIALHSRSQGKTAHIPYRNSMMTNVLRDSLGGNCKTTMIGCVAVEEGNLSESISTCQFAARVAQIKNDAKVNEELDPHILITRLRREINELKEEVRIAKSGEEENLTPAHIEQCHALVLQYVSKNRDPSEPFVCGSVERLRMCFKILRDLCRNKTADGSVPGGVGSSNDPARSAALEAEARKLKLEVAQRDQEIQILMQMLGKHRRVPDDKCAHSSVSTTLPAFSASNNTSVTNIAACETQFPSGSTGVLAGGLEQTIVPNVQAIAKSTAQPHRPVPAARRGPEKAAPLPLPPATTAAELLLNPEKAFKAFCDMLPKQEAEEENKELLRQYMVEGRALGEKANATREAINAAKDRLFHLRNERAMASAGRVGGDDDATLEDGPEELEELQELDRCKTIHKDQIADLRRVKGDIDNLKRLLEQGRIRKRKEFEAWFSKLRSQASVQNLDEDTKKDLYEKVTGKVVDDGSTSQQIDTSQKSAVSAARYGNDKTDKDISAFYAALGGGRK